MKRLTERKIILVTRETRVDNLIARFNTTSQAKFYVEHQGDDYGDYQLEHDSYYEAIERVSIIISQFGRLHKIHRNFLPNYTFGKDDIVVVLGQDGLVANTLKYLNNHPLIGVNPDPKRYDGVLLPFVVEDLNCIIPEVLKNKRQCREITIASATLNTGEAMYAVNDFFIGPKTHTSARYIIEINNLTEEQSSSGIIISTGLGSTGWFKSLIAGALGMSSEITGNNLKNNYYYNIDLQNFVWESNYLYFTVREPFPSTTTSTNLVFGKITNHQPLLITSRMSENGVIFSDGIEKDYLEFNSGTEATIKLADKKGFLTQ